jgi:hypothetical protein
MTLQPVNSLPVATTATTSDIAVLVQSGIYKKATLTVLATGLPEASTVAKGLMSAIDKQTLALTVEQISNLVAPVSTPIASAATIAVPSGRYVITLSGTTEITSVTGLVPRVRYVFSYPTGTGLTFLGEPMLAGDVVEVIDV